MMNRELSLYDEGVLYAWYLLPFPLSLFSSFLGHLTFYRRGLDPPSLLSHLSLTSRLPGRRGKKKGKKQDEEDEEEEQKQVVER